MKRSYFLIIIIFFTFSACDQKFKSIKDIENENKFKFAFLTDIHLQPEKNADSGFAKAIDKVNELNPDFVITGGDLIMDALGQSWERSDSLFNMYVNALSHFNMPVYNTIGNHEVYGLYEKSNAEPDHREYLKKMYQTRIGKRFDAFNYKNWRFYLIDGIGIGEDRYYGYVDSVQMEFIRNDLKNVDHATPIALSTHIPFITVFPQILDSSTAPNSKGLVVTNSKEVIGLFSDHNLKLVLQGHLHWNEVIKVQDITFITVGAVSGKWWKGSNHGAEEGFLFVEIEDEDFSYEYIDYDWEVSE